MWLDRFSGQSTPVEPSPPRSRTYSPTPRRPAHLAPGQTHRLGLGSNATPSTNSLDLSANGSNVSLTSTARFVNGSSLRQERKPSQDVPNPLIVLRSILGLPEKSFSQKNDIGNPGEAGHSFSLEASDDIEFGELGLEGYIEPHSTLPSREAASVQPRIESGGDRRTYEEFRGSISECDGVLSSVEAYLSKFQADLGQVSAEIENLQARSVQLNAKLENRRKVETRMGPAVEEMSLSPMTVRTVAEGPVDEHFLLALHEVELRSTSASITTSGEESARALADLKPLLGDLKTKAVERIRDYIVAQIKALRSPNVNAQVIQQQTFIKHKELYSFLARNHPILAEEVGQAYVNTMKWYYRSNFTRYQQALEKLRLHAVDHHDLLGADAAVSRRIGASATKIPQPQHDALGIGRRAELLKTKIDAAIPSYLAEEDKSAHYLETIFRSFNQALVDNICAEYSVVTELFSSSTFQQISRKVAEIFEPTFSIGHALTKVLVETTTDCLGVLLCVRLNQSSAFELQRRKVPVADSYINYTNILLWPRFQKIMDIHCESLKRVPSSTNRGASAAFSLVGGYDTSKASVAPHTITQRFGQFLHGILVLSVEGGDDEPIANSLGRLRSEFEALMGKLSKGVGDVSKRSKFLYNNYSLVMTIISDTQGKLAEEQKEHFSMLLKDAKGR